MSIRCPSCGSDELQDGDYRHRENETLELDVECLNCDCLFTEVYVLKEVRE